MRKYLLTFGSSLAIFSFLISCKKDFSPPNDHIVFPSSQKDKQKVETIKELGSILKEIYKNLWVIYEVKAAIKTDYYQDETVLLKDLLTTERSPLYKTQKFLASGAKKGVFKKAFSEQLLKGNYPNLEAAIGLPPSNLSRPQDEWPSVDSTNEIWTNENGLSIYFPYSEDYPLVNPLDVTINTVNGQLVTIVTADREADSGPGNEPYYCSSDPNQPMSLENMTICYSSVTVNDDYADADYGHHAINIVGVGAEPNIVNTVSGNNQVYLVFIGDVKCTHQFDHLISFTGNGGGSELRFIRGSAFLQLSTNNQITSPQNLISVNMSRKDIRKGRWKSVNSIWDSNWETNNTQQVFGIYEDDTQGSRTFSASAQTTLTYTGGSTQIGPFTYSATVQTQDDIIRQLAWDRTSFYTYNQGGLNNGCGTRNGWTIYDCNTYVMYTMPTQ